MSNSNKQKGRFFQLSKFDLMPNHNIKNLGKAATVAMMQICNAMLHQLL